MTSEREVCEKYVRELHSLHTQPGEEWRIFARARQDAVIDYSRGAMALLSQEAERRLWVAEATNALLLFIDNEYPRHAGLCALASDVREAQTSPDRAAARIERSRQKPRPAR